MVFYRALQKIAYPKRKIRFPRFQNPIQYLIADRNRRRRRRWKRNHTSGYVSRIQPVKKLNYTSEITNVGLTLSTYNINVLSQGTGLTNRATELVRLLSLRGRFGLSWEEGGTGNIPRQARVLIFTADSDFDPADIAIDDDIYDKQVNPAIGHVFYDKRFTRDDTTTQVTPVNIAVDLKGKRTLYDGTGSADLLLGRYDWLYIGIVSDKAQTSQLQTVNMKLILSFQG